MNKSRHDVNEALRHLEFVAELMKLGQIGKNPASDQKLAADMQQALGVLRDRLQTED